MSSATSCDGVRVESVVDGSSTCDPQDIVIGPPASASSWQMDWFGPGAWTMPIGGFLIRRADRVTLIDAGLGPMQTARFDTGRMLENLTALGVAPAEVTDVVLTHLHIDHVGWVSQHGQPTFANAVHHWHDDDWTWVRSGDSDPVVAGEAVLRRLAPVTDLMRLAHGERTEIGPGLTLRLRAGHTPGNCLVEVTSDAQRVYLLGDTAHHPATLIDTSLTDRFDVDRSRARRVRAELADELERTGLPAVGAHFERGRFGRVVRGIDGHRRWQPLL